MKHPSRFDTLPRMWRFAACVCLLSAFLAQPANAQTPAPSTSASLGPAERWVETRRVDRLEASIAELASSDGLIRRWGAVGAFVLGGGVIAGGIAIAAEEERWGGRGRAAVSGLAWAAGASMIAAGVYRLLTRTPAEERLERWSELRRAGKLDVFEFARFEGELASEAALAEFTRRLAAFGSFGLVAAGGGLVALGASSELDSDSSTDAYVLGGVMAGVGVIQSVALLLTRTPAERAFRHYREGGGGFFSRLRLSPAPDAPELVWRSM